MDATTIKIYGTTKSELDQFRQCKSESYDEVIRKVIYIAKTCKKQPKLSQKAVKDIEAARERIKSGKFLTEQEARMRLGL